MEEYIFLDTDVYGKEEYDIRGDEYQELIYLCCKYCNTFSIVITNLSNPVVEQLLPYQITAPNNVELSFPDYNYREASICYYRICAEVCDILVKAARGIFEWIDGWGFTNPNDPTFYREDGSVFFSSIIHDGVCILMPRTGEDVSKIIANPLWLKRKKT